MKSIEKLQNKSKKSSIFYLLFWKVMVRILDTLDCLLTKNGVVFKMFLERDVELPFLTAL